MCTPTPSTPAAWRPSSITRSRLRGSTGAPSSVVNTSPLSVHWLPARSFSAAWAALCFRSIATTAGDSGIVRRDRSVFGSVDHQSRSTRARVAAHLQRCRRRGPRPVPRQRQALALTQPGGGDEHQRGVVARRLCGLQHRRHVAGVQVPGLGRCNTWTRHQDRGIARQQSVAHRAVEPSPQHGVGLPDGRVGERRSGRLAGASPAPAPQRRTAAACLAGSRRMAPARGAKGAG